MSVDEGDAAAMPSPRPDLTITFTARADGSVVFRADRADGSATWQRHEGLHARYFPLHDLTHYAVETVLGARDGFYGLLAAGWDVADTGGKGARGPLPGEAVLVEHIVGLFDRERAGGAPPLSAADFQAMLATAMGDAADAAAPLLTDARLDAVRARVAALHAAWAATAPGERLSLDFARPPVSALAAR